MKTLLYTQDYPPQTGGVAEYYRQLVSHWPQADEIFVLYKKCRGLMIQYFCQFYYLFKEVQKNKIEYILVGQILPLGPVVHLLWRFKPIKYAVFLHGMDLPFVLHHSRKTWLARMILKDADKVICANNYTADLFRKNFPTLISRLEVVNPGVAEFKERANLIATEDGRKIIERIKNKTVLLSVGRLVKRKGFDSVINILKDLPSDIVYLIIGAGPEEEYLRSIAPENVIFIGAISEAEKWSYLDLCDIFIMPAKDLDGDFEGFGIVYLEANLCSKPVIAGNSGGVSDAVEDNVNGLLVNPENLEEIKNAIIKLIGDKDLREKLGRQGRGRAINDFSWQGQAEKVFLSIS